MAKDKATAKKKAKSAPAKKAAKPRNKPKPIIFKAPPDFKPFFAKVVVRIAKDGLFSDLKATRIKGSPTNENAKTVDMGVWDPDTVRKMAARYGGASFVTNAAKRLPPGMISFLMRVGQKKDTGALTTAFKEFRLKKEGETKSKLLDKKDPIYRRARKPVRFMPAAFTQCKEFPSAAELKALTPKDEEVVTKKSKKKAK